MKTAFLSLGMTVALLGAACDAKETCVADCDGQESPATESRVCGEARSEATEFIEQNRDCQTVLDCVQAEGHCYQGDAGARCGAVALSVDADFDEWQAIGDDMSEDCPCESGACIPGLICDEDQQCSVSFGTGQLCSVAARDVDTFLAASRACTSDAECMILSSRCRGDDCGAVAVNTSTNIAQWEELDTRAGNCGDSETVCNSAEECVVQHRCSDAGVCETFR